jgi:hypothetical protein
MHKQMQIRVLQLVKRLTPEILHLVEEVLGD